MPAGRGKNALIGLCYTLLVALGLFGSLKVVTSLAAIDPDATHSIMVWYGVSEHGPAWLNDWLFTQDNWLLSLFPLHFLAFSIFGPEPVIPLIGGWLIFVFSAVISGVIAWNLNARRAALAIPVLLLFLGIYAHERGLVSYSTTHNITNLFGLFSLYLILKWSESQRNLLLLAVLLVLVAGAVSDPWMIAAYNLPIAIVGCGLWLFRPLGATRTEGFKLLIVGVFSIVAVKSKVFGMLGFLPGMEYQVGDWQVMMDNVILSVRELGGLLNIVPFHASNHLIPALLSVGAVVSLLAVNVMRAVQRGDLAHLKNVILSSFAVFSIGGIVFAFVLNSNDGFGLSARFLINCLYLTVIGAAVLADFNWARLLPAERVAHVSVAVLFMVSGILSTLPQWRNSGFAFQDADVARMIDFLEKNDLTYGYGSYWGALANAVTAASHNEIRLRPVTFDKADGKMIPGGRGQTSWRWYTAQDLPPGQESYFVIVSADDEACPDIETCKSGLSEQFGPPVETLQFEDAAVLVWDHPLIGKWQSALWVSYGETIYFKERDVHKRWKGWSEPEKWGAWSQGASAQIVLALSEKSEKDMELAIEGKAFLTEQHPVQKIEVSANGRHIQFLNYDLRTNNGTRVVTIPGSVTRSSDGLLDIRLRFENPQSPAELGLSGDQRRLGLAVESVTLRAK